MTEKKMFMDIIISMKVKYSQEYTKSSPISSIKPINIINSLKPKN